MVNTSDYFNWISWRKSRGESVPKSNFRKEMTMPGPNPSTSLQEEISCSDINSKDVILSPRGNNPLSFKDSPPLEEIYNSFYLEKAESPTHNADEEKRVVFINNPKKNYRFCSNIVSTTQYSMWTFIPKFLGQRFSQLANLYFLVVGIGQMIPLVSSTNGIPMQYIPLAIVLFVDAIFTALEDYRRYEADKAANSKLVDRFRKFSPSAGRWESVRWMDVQVGDVIKVRNHEASPADIVILKVCEEDIQNPSGICFVETKSLDGETNLKVRQALACTFSNLTDDIELCRLNQKIKCEQPNHDIHSFHGSFITDDGEEMPIDLKNIALRGCIIRNTSYVFGVVVNTGMDTKIMQSSGDVPLKQGQILRLVDKAIGGIIGMLLILCLIGSISSTIWTNQNQKKATYLMLANTASSTDFSITFRGWVISFFYYWLLIAAFVPITLYVSVAIVKTFQSYFLGKDLEMYDEISDTPAQARNASLNDQLGQVSYIFSDKTGTLTANIMDFRKICVNGISYGKGTTEIGRVVSERQGRRISLRDAMADEQQTVGIISNVNFVDPIGEFEKDRAGASGIEQQEKIKDFLIHLALCHSVIMEHVQTTNEVCYSASSPDEQALVAGACHLGYEFLERSPGIIKIKDPQKNILSFELLEMIDFSSARKRMSVIVRDEANRILVLSKGADNVMFDRCIHKTDEDQLIQQKIMEQLESFAVDGLRTLVICSRTIEEKYFNEWILLYRQACSDLDEVEKQKAGEYCKIDELEDQIERNFELLGATAIEDRLQEGVPQCISDLQEAGIKIWVLTGDKEETAINIGFACQLLNNEMERLIINCEKYPTLEEIQKILLVHIQSISSYWERNHHLLPKDREVFTPVALIIDGEALGRILEDENNLAKYILLEFVQHCVAVIACRVSPRQKALLVGLVKDNLKGVHTLSIGDGANDVSMIQEAHIGVGISGQEGVQAVNASDFSIAQFRFLKRLLLVHGHWNYRRMSKLVLFIFYKNIMFQMILYSYSMYAGYSGTRYFYNLWLQCYNVLYTSIPILVLAVLDQETPAEMAENFPQLYRSGPQNELFNLKIFTTWILEAIFESTMIFLIPTSLFGFVSSYGFTYRYWDNGAIAWSSLLLVVNLKLILNMETWNWITHLGVWASIFVWFGTAFGIDFVYGPFLAHNTFPYIMGEAKYFLLIMACIVVCLGRDFLWKAYKREVYPEFYHLLQEAYWMNLNFELLKWNPVVEWDHRNFFRFDRKKLSLSLQSHFNQQLVARSTLAIHRGFAFSTSAQDFIPRNPLKQLLLLPKNFLHRLKRTSSFLSQRKQLQLHLNTLPTSDQEVFENQRYQIFRGWGSDFPGHLLLSDPGKWCDRSQRYSSMDFDTTNWKIEENMWGVEGWEYADSFEQFNMKCAAKYKAKRANKLMGRAVRRRKWIPLK